MRQNPEIPDLLESALTEKNQKTRESTYEHMWQLSVEDRRKIEPQWQLNMSFYLGNQYVYYNATQNSVRELKAPSHRMMIVDNRIMPKVRAKISRQMTRPGVQVVAATKAEIDAKRSEVKERILEHVDRQNNLPQDQYMVSLWGAVCGDAFIEVEWREDAGAMYRDGVDEFVEGDVRRRVRSPWECWPAPDARLFSWGSWFFIGELKDIDVVKDEYKKDIPKGMNVVPDGTEYSNPFLQGRQYGHGDFASSAGFGGTKSSNRDQVMVKRLFVFPTKHQKEGWRVTIINGREIKRESMDWFGLVHFNNLPYFDRFWGDTELRQCIPLQKQTNRMRSSIAEWQRTMVKGKWMVHEKSMVGTQAPNSEHFEIFLWKGQQPPVQAHIAPLPSDVWQELVINDQRMDDIFADRPVSQGKTESGVKSGVAIQSLQEGDDRLHTPALAMYERFWKEVYEKTLELAADKYDTGKEIQVVGDDIKSDVLMVDRGMNERGEKTGEDMLGGSNRVIIETGSSLPTSKVARRAMILEGFQLGLYGNPADPMVQRKVQKQVGDGIVEDPWDDTKIDETRAIEENQSMMMNADGKMPKGRIDDDLLTAIAANNVPAPYENHFIHMTIHNRARKSADFKKMEFTHPELAELFNAHCMLHEQMIAESMPQPEEEEPPKAGDDIAALEEAALGEETPAATPDAGLPI